jgi:hypothetical protein
MSPSRILLAALVLAGAGCGGGGDGYGESEFVDGYNRATAPLTDLEADFGSRVPSARTFTQVADRLDDVRGRLAVLTPPDGARDELDRMLAALDASGGQVRRLAKAVRSGDPDKIDAATRRYSTAGAEMVRAEDALRAAVDG